MKRLYNIVYKLSKAVGKLDKKSRGNKYEFVYVEKGAQHVGSIGTQIIINGEVLNSGQDEPPVLPECLATDKAMELWKKVIAEDWVETITISQKSHAPYPLSLLTIWQRSSISTTSGRFLSNYGSVMTCMATTTKLSHSNSQETS